MEIKEILRANNFKFNRALGQNFITDNNLLEAIVNDANVEKDDTVVEIGAGAGTLTRALAKRAKRVVAFEVDENLRPILGEVLKDFDNVEVHFADVLKCKDEELESIVGKDFKVVANLPYYITTPLIMRFLESGLSVKDMTLMMQKEVAERLIAKPGTAEYGAITVAVDFVGYPEITRIIDKKMFYPIPKVDSALLKIKIDKNKHKITDEKTFKKTVKAAFLWRRKTLANCLQNMFNLPKIECEKIIEKAGFLPMVRGEKLGTEEFIKLSELISGH